MFLDFRRCSLVFLDFRLCSFIFVDVCRFPQIFRRCQWILSDFRWLSYCRGHGSKNDRSWPKLAPDYTEPQNTHLDTSVWIYTDFRPRRQWSNYIWPFEKVKSHLVFFSKRLNYIWPFWGGQILCHLGRSWMHRRKKESKIAVQPLSQNGYRCKPSAQHSDTELFE